MISSVCFSLRVQSSWLPLFLKTVAFPLSYTDTITLFPFSFTISTVFLISLPGYSFSFACSKSSLTVATYINQMFHFPSYSVTLSVLHYIHIFHYLVTFLRFAYSFTLLLTCANKTIPGIPFAYFCTPATTLCHIASNASNSHLGDRVMCVGGEFANYIVSWHSVKVVTRKQQCIVHPAVHHEQT